MDIYLDDKPVAVADGEALTVQELVCELRPQLADGRRMLTTIRCDGKAVESNELEAALGEVAGHYGRIEFQTSDRGELVLAALKGAAELFEESDVSRRQAADLLNEGQAGKAMAVLGECFRAWSQAHESVVQSSQLLKLDLLDMRARDVVVGEWLGLLRDKLRELKEALEVSDHVLVADILRYEFDDISQQWKQIVAHLIERTQEA